VSWPVKERPKHLALAVGVILLAMLSVGLLTATWGATEQQAGGWALFAGALLALSLRGFFFPTRIRLDDSGIMVREPLYKRNRTWDQCKSLHCDAHGVLVSPFTFSTRMENYRGIYLRFAGNKETVMAYLEQRVEAPEERDD
jgi:hypothetical protein